MQEQTNLLTLRRGRWIIAVAARMYNGTVQ
jgi:hypothetical protein